MGEKTRPSVKGEWLESRLHISDFSDDQKESWILIFLQFNLMRFRTIQQRVNSSTKHSPIRPWPILSIKQSPDLSDPVSYFRLIIFFWKFVFLFQVSGDPFNGFTYEPSFNSESLQQHRIAMMQEDYF